MLKHNLLIAFRNFKKYKSSFLINIIGLSSGLTCVLFILLWVKDETSFDKFHKNEGQLFQLITNMPLDNQLLTLENSPFLVSENITKEFPEVEDAAGIGADFCTPKGIFSDGDVSQAATGIFATPNFFEVFSFQLLEGSKEQVLSNKYGLAISENLATKLFGSNKNAIGKSLDWNYEWSDGGGDVKLTVSGVFKTPPKNSTLQFEYVVHSDLLIDDDRNAGDWNGHYAKSFILLKEGTDIDNFNKKIEGYLVSKRTAGKFTFSSFLQKFSDRYLKNPYENGIQVGGRIEYVNLFVIIALFILLIACINFMNLATAQASRKMKEVGVKKAVGANRGSLIIQYLSESVLLSFMSLILALILVILLLPQFNALTQKSIEFTLEWPEIIGLVSIVLATGLIAGSYPAFRLSSFKPVEVLKGKLPTSFGEFWMRKGLVVFQFTLSIIFIIGIVVVNKQIEFTQKKNLGYERSNVVRFTLGSNNKHPETFLSEIKNIAGVVNVGAMNGDFLDGLDNNGGWSWDGQESNKGILFQAPRLSYNAIETLGMELLAGRTFSKERNDDFNKIIINESALKLMGLENPIGKILDKGDTQKHEIIGVVKDFQYGSIHKKVEPLIIRFREYGRDIMVKIASGTEQETLAKLEDLFAEFNPGYPFDYSFLDKDYQALYKAESRVADLSNYFGILAILISCLGLFGLATFTAERRAKEIGIRKILGSSIMGIVTMFSSEFMKMVFIAIVVAIPIGYWASLRWLENFGYSIDLQWWYFALAGLIAICIAMFTVSFQAIKAATVNPVKSLRTE
ncbi:FtsX-like permease family protein [Maribacter algarum]|uniref:FtsX-like permease family protein n=1 Tax=Maribacter algarum (ex Zhang et al. 2020) TaxID=2578118 RepID=A0A5S3PFY7_9FLAO|nr:ABC transporter permease [Maribacter algarum]TMM52129.1 FtsX-like permease family protein [Maribacter algarum]